MLRGKTKAFAVDLASKIRLRLCAATRIPNVVQGFTMLPCASNQLIAGSIANCGPLTL